MSFKTYAVFLCALLLWPATVFAGGFCCQMPTGVQEDGTASPSGVAVRLDYSYSYMSHFYEGSDKVSLDSVKNDPRFRKNGGVVPDDMTMQRYTVSAAYAPTSKTRVILSVPWVINDMNMSMFMMGMWSTMKMRQVTSLGDITVTGQYRIYQDRDVMPQVALTAGVGVKTPSGKSTVATSSGKRVHAHMQPGTGSWDPILSLNFVDMLSSDFLLLADARYEVATENHLGYSYGDTASVGACLKYNLLDFMNVSVGVNYFHSEQADDPHNSYNGHDPKRLTDFVGYTGEDNVWISPGIQVIPFKGASMDVKFQYPLYQHVPDIELVTDYRLMVGLSYSF